MQIKKLILILIFILAARFVCSDSVVAAQYVFPSSGPFLCYPAEYREAIQALHQLPESRFLMQEVAKNGRIKIVVNESSSNQFGALWDASQRTILVTPSHNQTNGTLLCSILFELHNASTNKLLIELMHKATIGHLSKDEYVERIERMEHRNAVNTSCIINKGIAHKIFPADAKWDITPNFDDHYKVQQLTGHSEWLAHSYENMNPKGKNSTYQGTIPDLHKLSGEDKQELLRYLAIKKALESGDPKRRTNARRLIKQELALLEDYRKGTHVRMSKRQAEKIKLLHLVF